MSKQKWFLLVLVLFSIFAVLGYSYLKLAAIKNLQVDFVGISIKRVGFDGIDLTVSISIYNPNKVSVTVGSFYAEVYANSVYLTAFEMQDSFELLAGQRAEKSLAFNVKYVDFGLAVLSAIREKTANWTVSGEYDFHMPFGIKKHYQFSTSRSIA